MIFAVSESAFVTNGNYHPSASSPYTTHDCTYYISDVHKINANLGSTPWPALPPLSDISPFSYFSEAVSDQQTAIGEALILGNIYDNN